MPGPAPWHPPPAQTRRNAPRMSRADTIREDASGLRIALLVSRYHEEITTPLDQGARDAFRAAGGDESLLEVFDCPGAFELAGLAGVAVGTGRFHGGLSRLRGSGRDDARRVDQRCGRR